MSEPRDQEPLSWLISTAEAARLAGVTPSTLRRWRGQGLPAHSAGRSWKFSRHELCRWLAATGRRPGARANPFPSELCGERLRLLLPRIAPVTDGVVAALRALHCELTRGLKPVQVPYEPETTWLDSSALELDRAGGGLWTRLLCTGPVAGDGMASEVTMVVADRLVVHAAWPEDSHGDVIVELTGDASALQVARQALDKLRPDQRAPDTQPASQPAAQPPQPATQPPQPAARREWTLCNAAGEPNSSELRGPTRLSGGRSWVAVCESIDARNDEAYFWVTITDPADATCEELFAQVTLLVGTARTSIERQIHAIAETGEANTAYRGSVTWQLRRKRGLDGG